MVTIGSLRYDIIADTAQFSKGIVATRRELTTAKKLFWDTRTPAEKLGVEIAGLNKLLNKGAIDIKTYNRALADMKRKHTEASSGIGALTAKLGPLGSVASSTARQLMGLASAGIVIRGMFTEMAQIDVIAKTARKLGMASNDLVALQLAASEFSGMADSQVNMALQRMTRRISEAAAGTGEAVKALKELGVNAEKLNEAGPAAAFREISDAMRNVRSEQDRLRLAFKLFDSEGASLVTTLAAGSDELLRYKEIAKDLGLTFSDDVAKSVELANDEVARMKASLKGLLRELAEASAPAIAGGSDFLTQFIREHREAPQKEADRWTGGYGHWDTDAILLSKRLEKRREKALEGLDTGAMIRYGDITKDIVEGTGNAFSSFVDKLADSSDTLNSWLETGQKAAIKIQSEAVQERRERNRQNQRDYMKQIDEMDKARNARNEKNQLFHMKQQDELERLKEQEEKKREELARQRDGIGARSGSRAEFQLIAKINSTRKAFEERRHREAQAKRVSLETKMGEAVTVLGSISEKLPEPVG